jgi:hypothetical protein
MIRRCQGAISTAPTRSDRFIREVETHLIRSTPGADTIGAITLQFRSQKATTLQPLTFLWPLTAVVNVLVASLHANCFSSAGCVRSGLSQTSSFNFQLRVDRDQRRGLRCLAAA